ncbi:hypothetical protein, partial [Streptomyces neyagawaensis]|uniref:hypothetical protein n=1 Tax=Streptomyces neyagawaensis TaxID=42238 RepID=UPI00197DAFDB
AHPVPLLRSLHDDGDAAFSSTVLAARSSDPTRPDCPGRRRPAGGPGPRGPPLAARCPPPVSGFSS